uniref:Thioredoxin domain-containing protein n=1 Tax=viral metagenome TaxID=1070528 RepID=A0A6C0DB95_9ZZZZ
MLEKAKLIEILPNKSNHEFLTESLNNDISSGKHIFLFIFMDGCEPCNQTKPQWKNIKKHFKHHDNSDIVVASINQLLFKKLNKSGSEPMGYPCLRYIKHPNTEEYEDSEISDKDRSTESFIEWIKSKTGDNNVKIKRIMGGKMGGKMMGGRKTKHNKNKKGGKWSLKYKRSINCRHPKGFSQKQHCKYGRKPKTLRRK